MPAAAVVGRDPRFLQQLRARGVCRVSEPEQRPRFWREPVLPDRERRDTHAAADKQWPTPVSRLREPDAEQNDEEQLIAGSASRQPSLVPRSDVLDQELELVASRGSPQHAERAWQERALAGPPAPALGGREHVELPGVRASGPRGPRR